MELESLLPYTQEPATCLATCPKPDSSHALELYF